MGLVDDGSEFAQYARRQLPISRAASQTIAGLKAKATVPPVAFLASSTALVPTTAAVTGAEVWWEFRDLTTVYYGWPPKPDIMEITRSIARSPQQRSRG